MKSEVEERMLNFYEFANRLDEVGGGALSGPLMAALKSAGSDLAKPKPKPFSPEKKNVIFQKPPVAPKPEVPKKPLIDPDSPGFLYKGPKPDIQGSSAAEKRGEDDELRMAGWQHRYPSGTRSSSKPQIGEPTQPKVEAPKAPLGGSAKIDALRDGILGILNHTMITKDPKRMQTAKVMLASTWEKLNALQQIEPKLVADAKQAITAAVEKLKKGKQDIAIPESPKAEWMDYYTMMEAYWVR